MRMEQAIEYSLAEEESAPSALASLAPEQPVTGAQIRSPHPRVREMAVLVARDSPTARSPRAIHLLEHTAAAYIRRILKKLNLQSRAQIGSWLIERRIAYR